MLVAWASVDGLVRGRAACSAEPHLPLAGLRSTGGQRKAPKMTASETCHYRGYDIMPMRLWSEWCVGIYRTRAE